MIGLDEKHRWCCNLQWTSQIPNDTQVGILLVTLDASIHINGFWNYDSGVCIPEAITIFQKRLNPRQLGLLLFRSTFAKRWDYNLQYIQYMHTTSVSVQSEPISLDSINPGISEHVEFDTKPSLLDPLCKNTSYLSKTGR
ncbi:uncharacterized protein EAF01_002423 [Botrytis porri]|uniref:uncharacterized protein n=1 Tax=Botrytis porri TaxID=87229 RepID=UPI001902AFEA|nr:uncharacterized protein EAF01_002423 [Botrytis porri]KAF7910914.1 hypothetical protein EAF01_002423 [Botrytis porri]